MVANFGNLALEIHQVSKFEHHVWVEPPSDLFWQFVLGVDSSNLFGEHPLVDNFGNLLLGA